MDVRLQQLSISFDAAFVLVTCLANDLDCAEFDHECNVWFAVVPCFQWCDCAPGWHAKVVLGGDDVHSLSQVLGWQNALHLQQCCTCRVEFPFDVWFGQVQALFVGWQIAPIQTVFHAHVHNMFVRAATVQMNAAFVSKMMQVPINDNLLKSVSDGGFGSMVDGSLSFGTFVDYLQTILPTASNGMRIWFGVEENL